MNDDKALSTADKTLAGATMIVDLIRKTDKAKPKKEDQAELDRALREHSAMWRVAGDLMEHTAQMLISDINGTYAIQESLKTGWIQLQKCMARPGDGELERLLIQQIALAWLKLSYVEYRHRYFLTNGNTTITQADFWERRLSVAQRRYLRAIETLARVRRMNLPAVQVNIGAQQVNQVK